MLHKPAVAVVLALLCVAAIAAQPGENAFRPLAKNHRWFELRDSANAKTSPLVRGALAAAFNDPATAERLLRSVIRDEPRSDKADDAYALLAYVLLRTGQYERFATLHHAWAAAFPASANARVERENFEKYRGRPNQKNGPRRRSVVRHDTEGFLALPVSINGKKDEFLFDTGAFQSAMTEMGGINWSNSGTAEFGGTLPASSAEPNLVFDGGRLVVRAEVLGTKVLASFDTGANSTDLNANFADRFPAVVAAGKKGSAETTGVGGTRTFASVELQELIFTVGSRQVPLRPAVVTMQRNSAAGGDCCIANAGHDLLKQAAGFVLNLATMTLELR